MTSTPNPSNNDTPHYNQPDWFTKHVFNPAVAGATRLGISVWGSRVLETRGRTSGQARRNPVNLLTYDGEQYLVAARGETQWVRNARAAKGRMTLILGRKRSEVLGTELADDDKIGVLRAYLTRWKMEVGKFFEGVGPDSTDDQLRAIAPRHPVFRITTV